MWSSHLRVVAGLATCILLAGCPNPLASLFEDVGLVPLSAIPEQAYQLAPSPDGARIAFSSADGLFLLDVGQPNARKLADSEGPITAVGWQDGRTVLFMPTKLPPPSQPGEPKRVPGPSYPPGHLQAVDTKTGGITSSAAVAVDVRRILPSPDGKYVAIARDDGLFIYDPVNDATTQVTDQAWSPAVAWAPDGRSLAYVKLAPDRSTAIVVYDRAEGTSRRIEGAGIVFESLGAESSCGYQEEKIAWTADGTGIQVVQHRTVSSFGVTTFGLDGQQRADRTIEVGNPGGGYVDCYHPSPDGRYALAWEIGRDSIPPPVVALVGVDLTSGQVKRRSSGGAFVTWLGATSRYVLRKSSRGTTYYVADAQS